MKAAGCQLERLRKKNCLTVHRQAYKDHVMAYKEALNKSSDLSTSCKMASGAPGVFGALVAVSVYTVFLSILGKRFNDSEEFLEYDTLMQLKTERLDKIWHMSVNTEKLCGYGSVALITLQSKAAFKTSSGGTERPDAFGRILSICLLLSGDIHQCPGPTNLQAAKCRQKKPTISSGCRPNCGKVIRANAKAVSCYCCDVFVHIRCGNIAPKLYDGQ